MGLVCQTAEMEQPGGLYFPTSFVATCTMHGWKLAQHAGEHFICRTPAGEGVVCTIWWVSPLDICLGALICLLLGWSVKGVYCFMNHGMTRASIPFTFGETSAVFKIPDTVITLVNDSHHAHVQKNRTSEYRAHARTEEEVDASKAYNRDRTDRYEIPCMILGHL